MWKIWCVISAILWPILPAGCTWRDSIPIWYESALLPLLTVWGWFPVAEHHPTTSKGFQVTPGCPVQLKEDSKRRTPGVPLWFHTCLCRFSLEMEYNNMEKKTFPCILWSLPEKTILAYWQNFWGFLWNTGGRETSPLQHWAVTSWVNVRCDSSSFLLIWSNLADLTVFWKEKIVVRLHSLIRGNYSFFKSQGRGKWWEEEGENWHSEIAAHEFM